MNELYKLNRRIHWTKVAIWIALILFWIVLGAYGYVMLTEPANPPSQ